MNFHTILACRRLAVNKLALVLWTILVLLLIGLNLRPGAFRVSTDLLELLPVTEFNKTTAMAADNFSRNISNRIFLLVHSSSVETARRATNHLADALRESDVFDHVIAKVEPDWLKQVAEFYYPFRFQLLSPRDHSLSSAELGQSLIETIWQILSSPSGLFNSQQFIDDPLFLLQRFLRSLSDGANNIKPAEGFLEVVKDGHYYYLVSGLLSGSVLSLDHQQKALSVIDNAVHGAMKVSNDSSQSLTNVGVIRSGMIFHAGEGVDNAKKEVGTVGIGSILGIVLLILAVFRSSKPLLLCMISITVGIITGYTVTMTMMGSVHLFTLVFGASLIGVSIDYSFHFFSEWQHQQHNWSPWVGLKQIMPGISLALITSVLGYLPMLLTPFPGLKQMALFSSFGLLMAWLTVVAVYPCFCSASATQSEQHHWPVLWAKRLLRLWQLNIGSIRKIYVVIVLVFCCFGILLLTTNDDIRLLQSRSSDLVKADQTVRDIVGDFTDNRFFLVKGKTFEQLLQHEEVLTQSLRKKVQQGFLRNFQAISSVLPSLEQQTKNYDKLISIYDQALPDAMNEFGLTQESMLKAQQRFKEHTDIKMKPDVWLRSPLWLTHGYLFVGQFDDQYFSAVLLSEVSPDWNPAELAAIGNNIILIDKTGETSKLFGRYRLLMSWLLMASFLMIAIILLFRYGWLGTSKVLIPPALAVLLTLSFLGITCQAINLFHVLALTMVVGIGVDYTLFFRESKGDQCYTFLAITLSVITTLLSFGLLFFSQTAAISSFGLTVLVGIACSYFLAPYAMDEKGL